MRKTSVYQLIVNDNIRAEALQDVAFYPKLKILNHDFNFYSTIYRALESTSFQSIQLLMNFLSEYENTMDYHDLMMLDLAEILEKSPNDMYFFLN